MSNRLISIGTLAVSALAILSTIIVQIGISECAEKSKNALEIIDLATEIRSIVKYQMNIPYICLEYTGRAEIIIKSEKGLPTEELKEINSNRILFSEKFDKLSSRSSYFYNTLNQPSPLVPEVLSEIRKSNLSGSTLILSSEILNFQDDITEFTKQCTENENYHPLWRKIDNDINSIIQEFSFLSQQCTNQSVWGKLSYYLLIIILFMIAIYIVPKISNFLFDKIAKILLQKAKYRKSN